MKKQTRKPGSGGKRVRKKYGQQVNSDNLFLRMTLTSKYYFKYFLYVKENF